MIDVHHKYFEKFTHKYLASRGLALIEWAESITSGLKGDILALFRLCLLVDKHCLLHLKNGRVWTTVENPHTNHDELLHVCNYHLVFLGRGIFIELKHCITPLRLANVETGTESADSSNLTMSEKEILNKVLLKGLGVGVYQSMTSGSNTGQEPTLCIRVQPSASAGSSKDLARVEHEVEATKKTSVDPTMKQTQDLTDKHMEAPELPEPALPIESDTTIDVPTTDQLVDEHQQKSDKPVESVIRVGQPMVPAEKEGESVTKKKIR